MLLHSHVHMLVRCALSRTDVPAFAYTEGFSVSSYETKYRAKYSSIVKKSRRSSSYAVQCVNISGYFSWWLGVKAARWRAAPDAPFEFKANYDTESLILNAIVDARVCSKCLSESKMIVSNLERCAIVQSSG